MPVRVFTQEEKEAIRIKMLDAGFPLLKEYGMTHTSISKITKAASIGVSTFYNFWKTKEEYMTDLIHYHRAKMLPKIIDQDVLSGKRKLRRDEVKRLFLMLVDEDVSIYAHMTLEDEYKLVSSSKQFAPDLAKETAITYKVAEYCDHARANLDIGLIANLTKLLAITAESRTQLHEAAYKETLDVIVEKILDLIFEEDESYEKQ